MRSHIALTQYARGHLVCARRAALPLREQVEEVLAQGAEVVFLALNGGACRDSIKREEAEITLS